MSGKEALMRWNKLRQSVRQASLKKAIGAATPAGWERRGRFLVLKTPPRKPKNLTPGTYGRFKVVNSTPSPKKNNTPNRYRALQDKIVKLEERITDMRREFSRKINPLEDKLEEYYEQALNLKKRLSR
jgi:hypothetical protein